MKAILYFLAGLIVSGSLLRAQVPAQPADPTQARPALPVAPDSITPAAPVTPATPSASTNSATAAPVSQIAVAIIADSSLKLVLQELAQGWADSQDGAPQVPITLTNASTLTAKVEASPAWDVVISADVADVKDMTAKGVITAEGQRSLARNSVVLYGHKALVKDDDLDWYDLIGTEWKKVALGNPDLVASGRVARHALQKRNLLDDDHKGNFIYEPMEKLAVAAVDREEADAVFLFKTDVVRMNLPGFAIFPLTSDDAPPIFYTASVSRLSKNPAAAHAFIDYCGSDAAKPIWQKYGFETN